MNSIYLKLLRPQQWIKNLLLLFPPFFAGKIDERPVLVILPLALISFSLAASFGYIINDIQDADVDKNHHTKKQRAVANGKITFNKAILVGIVLLVCSVLLSIAISPWYVIYLACYLIVSISYSIYFKKVVLLDIFLISAGFIIRVLAGGEAFRVTITGWLFLTVFMVSLLLASGKRLGELIELGSLARQHRETLDKYSTSYLESVMWFAASSALVTYALYALEHSPELIYSVPLVSFGLLRYIYIVKGGNGDPTAAIFKDRFIMTIGVVWLSMVGIMIYL